MDLNDDGNNESGLISRAFHAYNSRLRHILDKITPHHLFRWIFNFLLLVFFMYRVFSLQGFYIVAYVSGIFLLNQLILFLTPQNVDELDLMDDDEDAPRLPTKSGDEFRPFERRLPEFKFWYTTFKCLFLSCLCTYFVIFDIPVFWPILVMYFITLFVVTMKRQILHMIKHRYVPFSYGKIRYQGKSADGSSSGAKLSK
jgi:hypothetical protein